MTVLTTEAAELGNQARPAGAAALDPTSSDRPMSSMFHHSAWQRLQGPAQWAAKLVLTLIIAAAAVVLAVMTWQYYVTSPWTRNGVVRVQVASVAPQVSGKISEIQVVDNQFVHQGDVLYLVDTANFEIASRTAQSQVNQTAADLQVKQAESDRRQRLSTVATTPEEQQIYAGSAAQAKAAFEAATQQLSLAQINLERTKVRSPVNGFVTNLLLRVGDYATEGSSNVSVVDSDSFWIDGYFEETKLSQICIGDAVEAKLMSYAQPVTGHVDTITRGISVTNAAGGIQGLPTVNPVYTWVQLAQRVPVRIVIDRVPSGVPLVSGMTATVTVKPSVASETDSWFERLRSRFEKVPELFDPPMPRENCAGTGLLQGIPVAESLPTEPELLEPTPKQIDPGLVPGIDKSPRLKKILEN
ncbi:efflux RND transporter periplasmic adaptor subunit [Phyllobacterium sp. P5_D12]